MLEKSWRVNLTLYWYSSSRGRWGKPWRIKMTLLILKKWRHAGKILENEPDSALILSKQRETGQVLQSKYDSVFTRLHPPSLGGESTHHSWYHNICNIHSVNSNSSLPPHGWCVDFHICNTRNITSNSFLPSSCDLHPQEELVPNPPQDQEDNVKTLPSAQ